MPTDPGWQAAVSVVERERDAWDTMRRERARRGQHSAAEVAHVAVEALERLLLRLWQADPRTTHRDTTAEVAEAVRKRIEENTP